MQARAVQPSNEGKLKNDTPTFQSAWLSCGSPWFSWKRLQQDVVLYSVHSRSATVRQYWISGECNTLRHVYRYIPGYARIHRLYPPKQYFRKFAADPGIFAALLHHAPVRRSVPAQADTPIHPLLHGFWWIFLLDWPQYTDDHHVPEPFFCTGAGTVCFDIGSIDTQILHIRVFADIFEQLLKFIVLLPLCKTLVYRLPWTIIFRQIPPRRTGM